MNPKLVEEVARALYPECWGRELGQTAIDMGAAALFNCRDHSLRQAKIAVHMSLTKAVEIAEATLSNIGNEISDAIKREGGLT